MRAMLTMVLGAVLAFGATAARADEEKIAIDKLPKVYSRP